MMSGNAGFGAGRQRNVLLLVGWGVVVIVGVALIWLGFSSTAGREVEPTQPVPTATMPLIQPVATMTSPPVAATATPLPTATSLPTAPPATDTPLLAYMTAGSNGLNIRTGPGTGFTSLSHVDPGSQFEIVGKWSDWWQVDYNGTLAWVASWVVESTNTENVQEVQPPPSPIPPTAAPQPTATPQPQPTAAPPSNVRGIRPDSYQVEGAPGPYGVGADIWFNMWATNTTASPVEFTALGTLVEETGQFQKSWTYSEFKANQKFDWRDHINIPAAGTYHLWMTVCFSDGNCFKLLGPVEVKVQ